MLYVEAAREIGVTVFTVTNWETDASTAWGGWAEVCQAVGCAAVSNGQSEAGPIRCPSQDDQRT
jgi:hypothetical protein